MTLAAPRLSRAISHRLDNVDSFFRWLILIFVAVISLGPFVWLVLSTFKTNREVLDSALSFPSGFSLDAYLEVFTRSRFGLFFFNSLFVSSLATIAAILFFGLVSCPLGSSRYSVVVCSTSMEADHGEAWTADGGHRVV